MLEFFVYLIRVWPVKGAFEKKASFETLVAAMIATNAGGVKAHIHILLNAPVLQGDQVIRSG